MVDGVSHRPIFSNMSFFRESAVVWAPQLFYSINIKVIMECLRGKTYLASHGSWASSGIVVVPILKVLYLKPMRHDLVT